MSAKTDTTTDGTSATAIGERDVKTSGIFVKEKLTQDLRQAHLINVGEDGSRLSVRSQLYFNPSGSLYLVTFYSNKKKISNKSVYKCTSTIDIIAL